MAHRVRIKELPGGGSPYYVVVDATTSLRVALPGDRSAWETKVAAVAAAETAGKEVVE